MHGEEEKSRSDGRNGRILLLRTCGDMVCIFCKRSKMLTVIMSLDIDISLLLVSIEPGSGFFSARIVCNKPKQGSWMGKVQYLFSFHHIDLLVFALPCCIKLTATLFVGNILNTASHHTRTCFQLVLCLMHISTRFMK